mgnify:CR=1 FL=1
MIQVQLRSLKKGSIFRLHHAEGAPLWVRSSYDRSTKLYEIYPFDDFNVCRLRSGSTLVYVEPDFC